MFELSIKREFNVSVEPLFNAWCQPQLIQKWFAPGKYECTGSNSRCEKWWPVSYSEA